MDYLYASGFPPIEHTMSGEPLEIYRDREFICSVMPGGEIYSEHSNEDLQKIRDFVNKYLSAYVKCEYLPRMPIAEVYRNIASGTSVTTRFLPVAL